MNFEMWLSTHYAQVWYLGYAGSLFLFVLLENVLPLRNYECPVGKRFATHMGLLFISAGIQKFLLPIVPLTAAIYFQDHPLAVFNMLTIPRPAKMMASVLILDLLGYAVHVAYHKSSLLWRLHYPHHTDIDFDATTNLRFHPFESIITTTSKTGIIALFGIPAFIVMVLDIVHILTGFFTHWNVQMPHRLDDMLRIMIVTPNMHRIHHSAKKEESMCNFGGVFSFWDRLFRTYLKNPSVSHKQMALGMPTQRNPKKNMLFSFLFLPFVNPNKEKI